jgi:biotin carboxyl carrier protein
MKLEHRIKAAVAGVVASVEVALGAKVDAHQVLVVVDEA